jgi:hypothetical protein
VIAPMLAPAIWRFSAARSVSNSWSSWLIVASIVSESCSKAARAWSVGR